MYESPLRNNLLRIKTPPLRQHACKTWLATSRDRVRLEPLPAFPVNSGFNNARHSQQARSAIYSRCVKQFSFFPLIWVDRVFLALPFYTKMVTEMSLVNK